MTADTQVILHAYVRGVPVTQGNARAFMVGGKHKPARAVLVSKSPKVDNWREAIRATVVDALPADWQPATGPMRVDLVFGLQRPASHPKTRRTWPTGPKSGDWEKLARAVDDALTEAGVWVDDGQVVDGRARKDFVGYGPASGMPAPGVLITVTTVGDDTPTIAIHPEKAGTLL